MVLVPWYRTRPRPNEVRDNVSITRNSMYVGDDEDRMTCDVPDIAYS